MANCKICDKKLGFGEAHKIQNAQLQPYDLAYELQVCGDCLVTMNKLRAGETEAYRTIHKQIDSRPNSAVKKFVELWEKEKEVLEDTASHRFRSEGDVSLYLFREWQKLKGEFKAKNVTKDFAYFDGICYNST